MKMRKHINKRKATLSFLATALMIIWACVAMLPFVFMFCSSLKPGEEMLRKGLSLSIEPGVSSFSNYNALNTYRDGIYWQWYKSSVIIMVLQTVIGLFFGVHGRIWPGNV
jgi:ABC-type sugar transport system, permease component